MLVLIHKILLNLNFKYDMWLIFISYMYFDHLISNSEVTPEFGINLKKLETFL